jgi:hypothetical protein
VTALHEDGVSRYASDVPVEAREGFGMTLYNIWQGDYPFELRVAEDQSGERESPALGDVKVIFAQFPGNSAERGDLPFTRNHWHDTIDIEIVIWGELVHWLDDGSEVTLRQGDVLISNGTCHSWETRTAEGALVACIDQSATRIGTSPPDTLIADRELYRPAIA